MWAILKTDYTVNQKYYFQTEEDHQMKQKLFDKFAELFGSSEGAHFYFAPGRVNLIGEHTDYNGGHVFPRAPTMGTHAGARKKDDPQNPFFFPYPDKIRVVETSLHDMTKKTE